MAWMVIERPGVKLYRPYYQTIRRTIDITSSLVLTLLMAPILLIIAIAIRLDSPGPIFFIQERVGKGGRRFRMIKFRTMYYNVDTTSHQAFLKAFINGHISEGENKTFKPFKANHVTKVGRFLRKSSLDELPQLINVLRGEMSLIGPRPNIPSEVEEYRSVHQARLEILPGITGLAQVRGRSGITFDQIVQYDTEYVENQSIELDLKILWWTIASVLFGNGAE